MAVGGIAKKMLGLADEFIEGASKGVGDAANIRSSVNRIKSNMTKNQKKVLSNFGKSKGNASKAVNNSFSHVAGTAIHGQRLARPNAGFRANMSSFGNLKAASGIQNPTFANKAGDFFGGGVRNTVQGMKNGQSFGKALVNAHTDASGKIRYDRVAGSFMTASAAARIATGGGLYKDRNGSTNMIGVPFI